MQFYDEVKIRIKSGQGGNGVACGRRESAVPHGGPAGGDGGNGGSVIFVASKDENTLLAYKYRKLFKASYGENGKSRDKYGANAENLLLPVPVGTIIKDGETGEVLYSFIEDKEERIALKGGQGGMGNIHFKDSVNQYPDFALLGEPSNEKEIILELQLLGDVALIGTPSVGKSTIINAISNTKAKTAEYHFTTLIPNLGSVQHRDLTFNVIDIPGLIKGAADGKGLGNAFLRHILKSRIFCLVTDIARYESGIAEIIELIDEIMLYSQEKLIGMDKEPLFAFEEKSGMINFTVRYDGEVILEKIIILALNKYDLIGDEEVIQEYKKTLYSQINAFLKERIGKILDVKLLEHNTIVVSGYTRHGLDQWLDKVVLTLENLKSVSIEKVEGTKKIISAKKQTSRTENYNPIVDVTKVEKQKLLETGYIDEMSYKFCKVREIRNPDICRYVFILPRGNQEAENRFWKNLHEKGYIVWFEENKITKGDILKIVSYYNGLDDKYIVY